MFGLLLRADQETTKRAIIFGVRGVAGLARTSGDGEGRIEVEKEVCGSATPKVVSAWSFDGGGGATTPLMLSHPLSRRFSISICIYLHIPSLSLLLPLSLPLPPLSVVFPLLVFFVLAARVVLCWLRVRHSTYGGRCVRFFDKIQKKEARHPWLRNDGRFISLKKHKIIDKIFIELVIF